MDNQEGSTPFGQRLRRRRMALGLSQRDFAARVGLAAATISRYERGEYHQLTPERLCVLADALATSADYLIGRSNDPGPVPERPSPGVRWCVDAETSRPVCPLLVGENVVGV